MACSTSEYASSPEPHIAPEVSGAGLAEAQNESQNIDSDLQNQHSEKIEEYNTNALGSPEDVHHSASPVEPPQEALGLTADFSKCCDDETCSHAFFKAVKAENENNSSAYPKRFHNYLDRPRDLLVITWAEDGSRHTRTVRNAKTFPKDSRDAPRS